MHIPTRKEVTSKTRPQKEINSNNTKNFSKSEIYEKVDKSLNKDTAERNNLHKKYTEFKTLLEKQSKEKREKRPWLLEI